MAQGFTLEPSLFSKMAGSSKNRFTPSDVPDRIVPKFREVSPKLPLNNLGTTEFTPRMQGLVRMCRSTNDLTKIIMDEVETQHDEQKKLPPQMKNVCHRGLACHFNKSGRCVLAHLDATLAKTKTNMFMVSACILLQASKPQSVMLQLMR